MDESKHEQALELLLEIKKNLDIVESDDPFLLSQLNCELGSVYFYFKDYQ